MIIDFHTHIFPKSVRENRKKYFTSESAFELLYTPPNSKLAGAKDIIETMDEHEVDKSVVFGFPWKNEEMFKRHNDYILDSIAGHPRRLIGFGCFDPFNTEAASEAERCLDAGLSGIGELAFYQAVIDEDALKKLDPIMWICHDKELPVLIHTNEPVGHFYPGKTDITPGHIDSFIKRFATNKIVLAHWGGGFFFFNLLKREVKENLKNVYFDTAASPFLYDSEVYRIAVKIIGEKKILFGSDYPLIKPGRYFNEMDNAGLSRDEIEKICGANAAELLKQ